MRLYAAYLGSPQERALLDDIAAQGLSGISLIWSFTRNIRVLKAATAGVAAGELDREVEIRSRDEIGALARDFNQMIRTLSVQLRMVELRNGELQEGVATQRQLAEELAVARDRAEHAHEVRAQLIASIQHELHAPIKQIIAMAQLLSNERMGPLSELQQKLQANIVAGAQRVLRLMGELLELARVELATGQVELHGGRIWFESEPGQGTTFYFTIPAAESLPASLEASSPALPVPTAKPDMVEDGAQRRRSRPVLRPTLGDG